MGTNKAVLRAQALVLYSVGWGYKEIGQLLGVSLTTARRWVSQKQQDYDRTYREENRTLLRAKDRARYLRDHPERAEEIRKKRAEKNNPLLRLNKKRKKPTEAQLRAQEHLEARKQLYLRNKAAIRQKNREFYENR